MAIFNSKKEKKETKKQKAKTGLFIIMSSILQRTSLFKAKQRVGNYPSSNATNKNSFNPCLYLFSPYPFSCFKMLVIRWKRVLDKK